MSVDSVRVPVVHRHLPPRVVTMIVTCLAAMAGLGVWADMRTQPKTPVIEKSAGEKLLDWDEKFKESTPCTILINGEVHAARDTPDAMRFDVVQKLQSGHWRIVTVELCSHHALDVADLGLRHEGLNNWRGFQKRFIIAHNKFDSEWAWLLTEIDNTFLPEDKPAIYEKLKAESAERSRKTMEEVRRKNYMSYPLP